MKIRYCDNQRGATMLEMLGVLTIVIVLGISTIKLVGNVMAMFKQTLVVNEIRDLQSSISGRYRFDGHYRELLEDKTPEETAEFLCDKRMAPVQMCLNGKLFNRMNGEVWVLPVESESGEKDYFKYAMSFAKLSDKACLAAAQINWNTQKKVDVYRIIINLGTGNEVTVDMPHNAASEDASFPVLVAKAMRGCKNNDNNTIHWVFY